MGIKYNLASQRYTIIILLLLLLLTAGCGSKDIYEKSATAPAYDTSDLYQVNQSSAVSGSGESFSEMGEMTGEAVLEESEMAVTDEPADAGKVSEGTAVPEIAAAETGRKLIKTVYLNAETEEFDSLVSKLEQRTTELGGYIENIIVNKDNGGGRKSASLTIRIPASRLSEFVNDVSENSNILSREENSQDITLQYVDLKSRKDVLETEKTKLLEFMEKAETIEDVIALEARLSEVRYELESMEAQLRVYDNKVDYATIQLTLGEVKVLTPQKDATVLEQMQNGFMKSVRSLGRGLLGVAVWFVSSLPFLIPLAVIVFAVIFIVRKRIRKNRQRKQKANGMTGNRMEQQEEAKQPSNSTETAEPAETEQEKRKET